jgi:carboxylate-amine ligase
MEISSVSEHRFGGTPQFTLGVEEEFMLLDPKTLDLVQSGEQVLAAEAGGEYERQVSPELFESELEIQTPVCASAVELDERLRAARAHVQGLAGSLGLVVGSAGTHPFSLYERQRVTGRERYLELLEELQYALRRELAFGLHVHVAVDGPEKAIAVTRALQPHLAELVALSASSPLWRGQPTGLAASRHLVFGTLPRSGPTPVFRDWAEFCEVVARLEEAGLEDYTRIWWDIRPHPRLGTVEVRAMDAVSPVEDAVALAAYVQALVKRYADRFDAGDPLPPAHPVLVGENKWRAIRYGLAATVIDVAEGGVLPVRRAVVRTLRALEPVARELGSLSLLGGVARILRAGNGTDRQLRVYAVNHDPRDVVRDIAERTAHGTSSVVFR